MSTHGRGRAFALIAAFCALAVPSIAVGALGLPAPAPTVPAGRESEPVVLTGQDFAPWSVPSNQTANAPAKDVIDCPAIERKDCEHNHYEDPELDTADAGQPAGTPTERLLAYRWNGTGFEQIPVQVDEVFTRYLNNDASNFAIYSGTDQHTTYAYDREGFRFTANDPNDVCRAVPALDPASDNPVPGGPQTTPDPVRGLDDNDELVFMAKDAGPQAPPTASLPQGIEGARAVSVVDPLAGATSFVYVMKAAPNGPAPAFTAENGYVDYERDADADRFMYSESDFEGYGNAPEGPHCDRNGNLVRDAQGNPVIAERRPGDFGTISTDRYRFRYEGRWLMTDIRVSDDDDGTYGRDLVDRWKARAFAQDPSSDVPCCGFEEEDTNWGGSSQLLGELVGPVRAVRETWGADSGTNVIRREVFYRDEVRQKTWLRVHVIPPLDGIYAQWDFNAGVMTKYFNPHVPAGVAVDGKNDETLGNFDDPCNDRYDAENNPNNTSEIDQQYRTAYEDFMLCDFVPNHLSLDFTDPTTVGGANASLDWNLTTGAEGTIVDRISIDKVTDLTPGGAAQSLAALPYYRDDSCFDDGTGSDPGERINPGASSDQQTFQGAPRKCWDSESDAAIPAGDRRYFQGDIGAHGLHLMFQAESDNARLGVPLTEIVSQWRMAMLPGEQGFEAGEAYGRNFEKPLVATTAAPFPNNATPVAEFSATPETVETGQTVRLDASGSSDSDAISIGAMELAKTGSISRYQWDLDGNGSYETDGADQAQRQVSFPKAGTRTVGLLVTDNQGATATSTREVTVRNRGPQAQIGFQPQSPKTGEQVTFSGAGSTDPDGEVDRYEWDLDGDGSYETDTSGGDSAGRSYERSGTYTVGLRVSDDGGASDETSTQVTVANRAPEAAIAASPAAAPTGDTFTFDASGSADPDGSVAGYEWDLDGDGSFETDTGGTPQAQASYPKSGTRTIAVRVTDDEGASGRAATQIQVQNRGPQAAIEASTTTPSSGEDVTFDASGSSDADGEIANYEWDLDGDGSFETDTGDTAQISRSFAHSGAYTVGVRVTDDEGASGQATTQVTVANTVPLAAMGAFPSDPATYETVNFEAAGSLDPDGAIASYEWDLDGDGSFETNTGTTGRASRSYSTAGTRTISVRITDDEGGSEVASLELTVVDRVTGFSLDAAKSGIAGLSYTALRPVHGELELQLVGLGKRGDRILTTRIVTSEQAGAIRLSARIPKVKKRCRRYTHCALVARGTATIGGATLHDQSRRVRIK